MKSEEAVWGEEGSQPEMGTENIWGEAGDEVEQNIMAHVNENVIMKPHITLYVN